MSNDIELTAEIKFQTDQASASAAKKTFDDVKVGAEGAAASVNKVKPAAGADKEFVKVQGSAEKSFAAIDSARQVTEGGIMGLGQAVKNLASQFPALSAALGPVGLALAAFSAWKKAVDTVVAAHAALETSLRSIRIGNIEAQIKSNAAAYDAYYQSIKRAADERQRFSDIEASTDDANLRSQIAALDLKRAQEKAMMNPDDEIGNRKADLAYAEQRAALEDAAAKRKSERDDRDLAAQETAQRSLAVAAKEKQDDAEKSFRDLINERVKIEARIQKAGGPQWWSAMGAVGAIASAATSENRSDAARAKAQPEIDNLTKNQQDIVNQVREAELAQYNATQAIVGIRAMRDINRTDRKTADTQNQTRQTDNYVTGTGIDRDEYKRNDELWQEFNAVMAERNAYDRNMMNHVIEVLSQRGELDPLMLQKLTDQEREIQANKQRVKRLN